MNIFQMSIDMRFIVECRCTHGTRKMYTGMSYFMSNQTAFSTKNRRTLHAFKHISR